LVPESRFASDFAGVSVLESRALLGFVSRGVEQAAEPVAPTDTPLVVGRRDGPRFEERRLLLE
jgi:hypothetical protein